MFLLQAAWHRAAEKARRFLRVAGVHGVDEAWYLAVAEALGYHANREPMRVLAQRVPIRLLRQEPEVAEALLFGHAGFLDQRPFDEETEPDARRYLRGLWEGWWKHRSERVRQPNWDYAGMRPANHPQRRVAVLAMIACRWKEFRALAAMEPEPVEPMIRFFAALRHPFWSGHFTLSSEVQPEEVALAGRERVIDFLGNTVLPVRAMDEPAARLMYENLPGGQPSRAVQRAAERLLGRRPDAKDFLRRFALQQGLLQVYRDFCLEDASECHACPFPEQLARWRPEGFTRAN